MDQYYGQFCLSSLISELLYFKSTGLAGSTVMSSSFSLALSSLSQAKVDSWSFSLAKSCRKSLLPSSLSILTLIFSFLIYDRYWLKNVQQHLECSELLASIMQAKLGCVN